MVLFQIGRQRKMKKTVIESSHKITLRLVSDGKGESGNALSPFGPVRAGLTTTQKTSEAQALTELLNCLEKKIAEANIKSLEVLNTFLRDTTHLVEPTSFGSDTTTTRV